MHRFTLRFIVAFLTFVLGVSVAAVWIVQRFSPTEKRAESYHQQSPTVGSADSLEIPTVAFCKLLTNPADYNRKIVRTQAILTVNANVQALSDLSCFTKHPMVGIEPDPSFHHEPSDMVQKEFYDLVRPEREIRDGQARVTIVGRFEGPILYPERRKSQYIYQFIVLRLEKAESVAPDAN